MELHAGKLVGSDLPDLLRAALNSFRKRCTEIFSLFDRTFGVNTYDYGQDFRFYCKTKRKAEDKTTFPKGINGQQQIAI